MPSLLATAPKDGARQVRARQDEARLRLSSLPRRLAIGLMVLSLAACGGNGGTFSFADPTIGRAQPVAPALPLHANETPELRGLINKYAAEYGVPVGLVHRVVKRESTHNPAARNGPYYGLMQILPATARSMGFRGEPADLLDAETNLRYAVRYLRGAWLVSGGDPDAAVGWYARGYYYEAKRLNMLDETGLRG